MNRLFSLIIIAGCAVVHPALSFAYDGSERVTDKGDKVLRIASYNVGVFGKTDESSIDLIAGMMKELEPDMIAMQELDSCANRSGKDIFQLKEFAKEMGDWHYRFARAIPFEGGGYGTGMAISPEFNPISSFSVSLPQGQGAEARALAVIETEEFAVASVHLDHVSDQARLEQMKIVTGTLKKRYGRSGKPVFLCGDFNSTPESETIAELKKDWTILSPLDATIPSTSPKECIDYIAILNNGAKYETVKAEVCRSFLSGNTATASDHLPVFVEIRLLPSTTPVQSGTMQMMKARQTR